MNHFPGLYLRGKIYWFARQTLGVREFVSLKTGDLNESVKLAEQQSENGLALAFGPAQSLRGQLVSAHAPL